MSRALRLVAVVCLAWLVLAFATLWSPSASAHAVGLSRGEYRVVGSSVATLLVFSGTELATALPDLDTDYSGQLSAAELANGTGRLGTAVVGALAVRGDGASCAGRLQDAELAESDAVRVHAAFECPGRVQVLSIDAKFIDLFASGHRHLATVFAQGRETSAVLVPAQEEMSVTLGRASDGAPVGALVWLGMTHIWTGYDHLAFLFGLVVVGGTWRGLVAAISAFTVAHSITLGLAVLHVVSIRPSIIEPAIALSIAYVGLENLFIPSPTRRWRVTFPFGLVHGFGFAGALTELDLPVSKVPLALLAFNGGVEIGQLAVLAVVLPLVLWARRSERFRTTGVRVLSVGLAAAGAIWFVLRV